MNHPVIKKKSLITLLTNEMLAFCSKFTDVTKVQMSRYGKTLNIFYLH